MLAEMAANSFAVLSARVKWNSSLNEAREIEVPMKAESYLWRERKDQLICSLSAVAKEGKRDSPDHDRSGGGNDGARVYSPVVDCLRRRPVFLAGEEFDHFPELIEVEVGKRERG
jgi:hypothetical protein